MKIKYIMHNVQDNSVLYNNAVHRVICEGWHFTQGPIKNWQSRETVNIVHTRHRTKTTKTQK